MITQRTRWRACQIRRGSGPLVRPTASPNDLARRDTETEPNSNIAATFPSFLRYFLSFFTSFFFGFFFFFFLSSASAAVACKGGRSG